jgi:cytochrome c553
MMDDLSNISGIASNPGTVGRTVLGRTVMKNSLLLVTALLSLAGCSDEPEPVAAPVADIEAGRAIAEADCAGCHGMDGRGVESDIPNLAAQPVDYLIDALHAYRDGRRRHAALRDLTSEMGEKDIRDIAAYYASLAPLEALDEVPSGPPSDVSYTEGAEVAAVCADCHGDNGDSTEPGVPSLAGQQPAYLIASTVEYVRGDRGHEEKEIMLRSLRQIDIEKMAMYFAAQLPAVRQAPPFGDPVRGEPLSAGCGECHGARGISHDPLVPSLAGQEPNYLVAAITAYRSGERQHEEMITDRTDEQIEDIAAYYAVQAMQPAAGESVAVGELAAKCDRCHGPIGRNLSMPVPSLDGQNRDYLIKGMKAYRGDDRGSSMMHKMSAGYSDEMIEAIAGYYARRPAN